MATGVEKMIFPPILKISAVAEQIITSKSENLGKTSLRDRS